VAFPRSRPRFRSLLLAVLIPAVVAVPFVAAVCGSGNSSGSTPSTGAASTPATAASTIDGIPCNTSEQLKYHVHSHLTIFVNGEQVAVPANIGIDFNARCLYWLHTHDNSGVIHVEAPSEQQFTLGQFFAIWGKDLSATSLLGNKADAAHQVRAFVDGQPFMGDPATISLGKHTDIVLEYGPPFPQTPGPYPFPRGL
jgi:hypothetical protein